MNVQVSGELLETGDDLVVRAYLAPEEAVRIGADRTDLLSWRLPWGSRTLAERLLRAVCAQKALTPEGVERDVEGKTYLRATVNVWGKYANSDLRKLGF
jgi:hypothetical protein